MSRSSRTSTRLASQRTAESASPLRYGVSSPGANSSLHDNSANSSLYRSGSDRDSESDDEGGRSSQDSLDVTYDGIDVEQDVSPVPRPVRREKGPVEILSRSGPGSPRTKRKSPGGAGSPASSARDGSLFGSPLTGSPNFRSPSLRDEMRTKGKGSALKYGVGSISPDMARTSAQKYVRRSLHESATRHTGTDTGGGFNSVCLVAVAIIAVAVGILVFNPFRSAPSVLRTEAPTQSRREVILGNLVAEIQDLRAKFPGQDRRFWSVIAAATKSVLQVAYPAQPAVLMFVAPSGGEQTDVTDCLATHVTEAVKRAHNTSKALKLNLRDFTSTGKTPDVLKLELDDVLSSSFGSGDKAGLLYNIQDLPSRTAMLFHSYCDNDNAPFKDVTLTFTVKMDKSAQAYSGDESLEEFFYDLWSDLDKDTLSPLLSRVANSVAVVKPESAQVLEQHCK